jgi:hypothetical protein
MRKFGGLSRVFGVKKSEDDPYLEGYRVKVTAKSMDDPPPGYRFNVGVCLINYNNQVFVASRLDVPGAWQMPQGGVDEREDPRAAAIRELREKLQGQGYYSDNTGSSHIARGTHSLVIHSRTFQGEFLSCNDKKLFVLLDHSHDLSR